MANYNEIVGHLYRNQDAKTSCKHKDQWTQEKAR